MASSTPISDLTPAHEGHAGRILLVDDEADVLAGLRSSLRKERKRFDLVFAQSGEEALVHLGAEPFDVVVSDMRMPGMSGAELLGHVRDRCPGAVRIVLTGEAEAELVFRALPVAHQWLAKPCSRDRLVAALDAALQYRSLMSDRRLQTAASSLGSLPSPPARYLALVDAIRSPEASMEAIGALIGSDPAIAAKVVQLANSAFSAGRPVVDLHGAITRIGLEHISHIVLSAELHRPWDDEAIPGVRLETLSGISERAATIARELASHAVAPASCLAALLHGVGLLVEAKGCPDVLAESYRAADVAGETLVAAEIGTRGVSHAQVGAHLLSMWGLPTDIVLAVAESLEPADDLDPDDVTSVVRHSVARARLEAGDRLGAPHQPRRAPSEDLATATRQATGDLR